MSGRFDVLCKVLLFLCPVTFAPTHQTMAVFALFAALLLAVSVHGEVVPFKYPLFKQVN